MSSLRSCADLFAEFGGNTTVPDVRVEGRLVYSHDIGRVRFLRVVDSTGGIQLCAYANDEGPFEAAGALRLGDLVWAQGDLTPMKSGQITLRVHSCGARDA